MPLPAILSTIGSFLGNVGTAAAGVSSLASIFGGNSGRRVRREDFDHHQNLADVGNPREIRRQNEFLRGVAPAQADAYNIYQDATYGEDTRREIDRMNEMTPVQAQNDLQYMDTVYAGTSAWERLGSNAAPSISAPAPAQGAPRGGSPNEAMAELTPLVTAGIQADTQKEIAFLNNMTSLQQTRLQTNNGALPEAQTATQHAEQVLKNAQAVLTNTQTSESEARTQNIQADTHLKDTQATTEFQRGKQTAVQTTISAFEAMLKFLPKEEVDLVIYKFTSQPGMEKFGKALAEALNGTGGYGVSNSRSSLTEIAKGMNFEEQKAMIKSMAEIAGLFAGAGRSAATLKSFLPKIGKASKK